LARNYGLIFCLACVAISDNIFICSVIQAFIKQDVLNWHIYTQYEAYLYSVWSIFILSMTYLYSVWMAGKLESLGKFTEKRKQTNHCLEWIMSADTMLLKVLHVGLIRTWWYGQRKTGVGLSLPPHYFSSWICGVRDPPLFSCLLSFSC